MRNWMMASAFVALAFGLDGAAVAQPSQTPPAQITGATPSQPPAQPQTPARPGIIERIVTPPPSAQETPGQRDTRILVEEEEDESRWVTQQQVARIVLYDAANRRGPQVGITRDTPDLAQRNFANVASAVRVYYGTWELCSEPNYGGECRRFSSHANVNRFGIGNPVTDASLEAESFSDTVASIRLVRAAGRRRD